MYTCMCLDFLRLRAKLYLELTFKIPGKTWNEAGKIEWEPCCIGTQEAVGA